MINFNYKDITIVCSSFIVPHKYLDARKYERTRFEKKIKILISFWDFYIDSKNLTDLAYAKSLLHVFVQWYWRRIGKSGKRIDLAKVISKTRFNGEIETLCFTGRQKNGDHYLQIGLRKNDEIVNEMYLEIQEIIMIDIALGKALNLMAPFPEFQGFE
jgi:hypothetical protein